VRRKMRSSAALNIMPMKQSDPSLAPSADAKEINWGEWLQEHGQKLLLFARQQTRSIQDAEDVLQTSVVKLAAKIQNKTFVGEKSAWLAYIYTQIRREAIDLGRKDDRRKKREHKANEEDKIRIPWFEQSSNREDSHELLSKALKEISPKFAEVITMKIWGEQTFAEISDVLEISLNTAASRYRYGLEALQKKLQGFREASDL